MGIKNIRTLTTLGSYEEEDKIENHLNDEHRGPKSPDGKIPLLAMHMNKQTNKQTNKPSMRVNTVIINSCFIITMVCHIDKTKQTTTKKIHLKNVLQLKKILNGIFVIRFMCTYMFFFCVPLR